MITSNVRRGIEDNDAQFAWVLDVRGVPSECGDIRWEQFVSGGFTIHFSDGTSKYYSAAKTMQQINPHARQFGPWMDDLLPGMTPGPRPLGAYQGASCQGGVLRSAANPRATMRGPSADPRGATYQFEDTPGFGKDFGDTIAGKTFVGISWNVQFEHKLWRTGDSQPLHRQRFTLTGRYDRGGSDTRRII
jgi:hypothetical protein